MVGRHREDGLTKVFEKVVLEKIELDDVVQPLDPSRVISLYGGKSPPLYFISGHLDSKSFEEYRSGDLRKQFFNTVDKGIRQGHKIPKKVILYYHLRG